MSTLDYYEVLHIEKDASDQQIKKAYRKLALKFHPDKNSSADAVEKFKDISEAYEILSDPEKRRVYDNRGNNPMHEDEYGYHNPFAGFAFHNPEEIFAEFFNHMGVFGRGGDMFSSFMMPPMHQAPPPPPPFHGFNRQFMTGGFGGGGNPFFSNDFMSPMMGPFQQQQQQQSSSSYIGTSNMNRGGGGGGYSKSVSTSTRNINGVVESVKITKITDENGTKVIEEYGNGITKINGVEQPAQHQIESGSPSNNSRSVEKVQPNIESEGEEEEEPQHDELDEYDEHRDYFYRQEQLRLQQLKLQQDQQRLWDEQRRHEDYMRQQRERMHQQHMQLHQQQMMQHMYSPFQQQQQQQQSYNYQDDLFDNIYGNNGVGGPSSHHHQSPYQQYNHFL